jgi:hypothetical protein
MGIFDRFKRGQPGGSSAPPSVLPPVPTGTAQLFEPLGPVDRFLVEDALEEGLVKDFDAALQMLRSGRKPEVVRAIVSIANVKDPRAFDSIVEVSSADGFDRHERSVAIAALGYMHDLRAVDALTQIATMSLKERRARDFIDEDEKAVLVLGRLGDQRAFEPLAGMIGNGSKTNVFHQRVAIALCQLDRNRAVDPLIKMLQCDYWSARSLAADLLGEIGDPRALDGLAFLADGRVERGPFDDPLERDRESARRAIQTIKARHALA